MELFHYFLKNKVSQILGKVMNKLCESVNKRLMKQSQALLVEIEFVQ